MKIRRKDVIEYAESISDSDYGRCEATCKHYGRAIVCGECYCGSRYCFDWRHYLDENKEAINKFLQDKEA